MEARRLADLHAYVDGRLEPGELQAFEARLAGDPALWRRAARWRAQNNAIRAAFDRDGAREFAVDLGLHANNKMGKTRRSASPGVRLARAQAASRPGADGAGAPRLPTPTKRPWLAAKLGVAALSVGLVCAWAPGPTTPSNLFGEAGAAAFGAFALPGSPPVELASRDPQTARTWLTAHLGRPVYLPETPANLSLVGARIAPASRSAAAFVVYDTDRGRLGLLVQSLDAPPRTPPRILQAGDRNVVVWTRAGQEYALVGDFDAPSLRAIATAFFKARYEPDPATPERGS